MQKEPDIHQQKRTGTAGGRFEQRIIPKFGMLVSKNAI